MHFPPLSSSQVDSFWVAWKIQMISDDFFRPGAWNLSLMAQQQFWPDLAFLECSPLFRGVLQILWKISNPK